MFLRSINRNFCKFLQYCSLSTYEAPTTDKPILYGDEISPPVRFVSMTAFCLGIDLDFRKIDLFKNENKTTFFKKINPLQKVPTMVLGSETICDSHAISLYLCQISDDYSLYPNEVLLRAKINQMLFFNSSTLFRIDSEILTAYFSNQWPINENKIQEWILALDYLESQLKVNKWLVGDKMHLCDICIVTVVTSMLCLIPLTERHPKVEQWIKMFEKYPFYEINKRGLYILRNRIEMMKNVYK